MARSEHGLDALRQLKGPAAASAVPQGVQVAVCCSRTAGRLGACGRRGIGAARAALAASEWGAARAPARGALAGRRRSTVVAESLRSDGDSRAASHGTGKLGTLSLRLPAGHTKETTQHTVR